MGTTVANWNEGKLGRLVRADLLQNRAAMFCPRAVETSFYELAELEL